MKQSQESSLHNQAHDKHLQAGGLVNGVTHELNNRLGVVLAYAQLIGLEGGHSEEILQMLRDIEEMVKSSTRMLETLTYVTREKKTKARRVEIQDVLERVKELYQYAARKQRIAVDIELDGDLNQVRVHEPSLIRALMYVLSDLIPDEERGIQVSASGNSDTVIIHIAGSGAGSAELPEYIVRARDIVEMQSGEFDYDSEGGITIRIPREPESLTEC